jgi:hypothetical protein
MKIRPLQHSQRPGYAAGALILMVLIGVAIMLALFVIPTGGSGGSGSGSSYGQQLAQGKKSGMRAVTSRQAYALMQSVVAMELSSGLGGNQPKDTQELIAELKADGSASMLGLDRWEAPNPADPPIVYVPKRERRGGAADILFYEHPQNHDGAGGHVAYAAGGVKWLDEAEFQEAIAGLPQPTW